MSTLPKNNLEGACQKIRQELTTAITLDNPLTLESKTGMLDMLTTQPKTIDIVMRDNSNNTQYRPVEITSWDATYTDAGIVQDVTSLTCSPGTTKGKQTKTYEPTLETGFKVTIGVPEMRQYCDKGNWADFVNQHILPRMRDARKDVDAQLLAKAVANVGANPGAETAAGAWKDVELLKADGAIDSDSWQDMLNFTEDSQMNNGLKIVGLGKYRRFINQLGVGCCNDAGVDIAEVRAQLEGFEFYKDHNATTTIMSDADRIVGFAPGWVQFYQYNMNGGMNSGVMPNGDILGTMPDSKYPMMKWDYILKYVSGCDGNNTTPFEGDYVWVFGMNYDLFIPPTEIWNIYDPLVDMNGIFGYRVTQAS